MSEEKKEEGAREEAQVHIDIVDTGLTIATWAVFFYLFYLLYAFLPIIIWGIFAAILGAFVYMVTTFAFRQCGCE